LLWYDFIGLFAGYGYLPGRAFWWSVGFVAAGTILFRRGHRQGFLKPKEVKANNGSNHHRRADLKFNSFIYSLETFVPLLELDMAKEWKPAGKVLRFYFYLHRIFGWILTTLWIGGFTGLVKT
jgi:hypothetical protein